MQKRATRVTAGISTRPSWYSTAFDEYEVLTESVRILFLAEYGMEYTAHAFDDFAPKLTGAYRAYAKVAGLVYGGEAQAVLEYLEQLAIAEPLHQRPRLARNWRRS